MPAIAFGRFLLDTRRRVLLAGGEPVKLQSKALDVLELLIAARDRAVGREEILAQVWHGQTVAESNLTVQMSNLRRALAAYDAEALIITVNRAYRFVGDVTEVPDPHACAEPVAGAPLEGRAVPAGMQAALFLPTAASAVRRAASRRRMGGVAGSVMLLLAGAAIWHRLRAPQSHSVVARVRVETLPDEVSIDPGGLCRVDYSFSILNGVDLQLETEDWQFFLPSGQPVGPTIVGGRIYRGSFPIMGGTTGVYHNNIYLIPDVAAAARLSGNNAVQLRHIFHLRDAQGDEMRLPAVLFIHIGPQKPVQPAWQCQRKERIR